MIRTRKESTGEGVCYKEPISAIGQISLLTVNEKLNIHWGLAIISPTSGSD